MAWTRGRQGQRRRRGRSRHQALAKGTEAFAAQRMNEGIRKALAGKNLESL
jgi:hypothetical protein